MRPVAREACRVELLAAVTAMVLAARALTDGRERLRLEWLRERGGREDGRGSKIGA